MTKTIDPCSHADARRGLPRWHVARVYRSEAGPVELEDNIEELHELHDLVERGPDWDTLIDLRVSLNRPTHPGLTLEQAEEL